jgi:hypothetical protein
MIRAALIAVMVSAAYGANQIMGIWQTHRQLLQISEAKLRHPSNYANRPAASAR